MIEIDPLILVATQAVGVTEVQITACQGVEESRVSGADHQRARAGRLPREANVLSFSLAGDGEIDLSLVAKKPGPALDVDTAHAQLGDQPNGD